MSTPARFVWLFALVLALTANPSAATSPDEPSGPPLASVDLATSAGVALTQAQWRTHPVRIVAAQHRAPDAEGQPTGAPIATYTIEPRAGSASFDDSAWEAIAPESLAARRGGGRVTFQWYRIAVTIPERVGAFDPTGSTVIFQTTVDDYAEIWVDGEIARALGQRGGSVVAGWNAPNRVVIARNARPGQRISIALFGGNGPLSDPPANFIWVREARLEFFASDGGEPRAIPPAEVNIEVVRRDPRIDRIVPQNPKLWKLAEGFQFTEGPLWLADRNKLLFSDPNANRIYEYDPAAANGAGALRVFRERSGYDGADIAEYGQPGSNGLARNPKSGALTLAEHGRHRISELGANGAPRTLVDALDGKRLNSPNDLVFRSDGALFFSDPPFGLPKFFDDPRKQLPFSGVYSLRGGKLRLVSTDLTGPNGVAFSPDEKQLYVTNWDVQKKVVMRYDVARDGSLSRGRVFFDMTSAPGEEALDGIKVDREGNLYVSGPGGLWILAPDGTHLGTLRGPRLAANMAWGEDGKSLFLTARSGLYKTRLLIEGAGR
jgi:gluconolactonase